MTMLDVNVNSNTKWPQPSSHKFVTLKESHSSNDFSINDKIDSVSIQGYQVLK